MRYHGLLFDRLRCCLGFLLLMLCCPLLQAEGLRSPEAVAHAFVQAYRSGQPDAIVALQLFADGNNTSAAVNRERQAWLRYVQRRVLRSYRVDPLLARDQVLSHEHSILPQKKLVVVYGGKQQERWEEVYLIASQGGSYYLLSAHQEQ